MSSKIWNISHFKRLLSEVHTAKISLKSEFGSFVSVVFGSLQGLVRLLLRATHAESLSSHSSVLVNVYFVMPVLINDLSLVHHIIPNTNLARKRQHTHAFSHKQILAYCQFPVVIFTGCLALDWYSGADSNLNLAHAQVLVAYRLYH